MHNLLVKNENHYLLLKFVLDVFIKNKAFTPFKNRVFFQKISLPLRHEIYSKDNARLGKYPCRRIRADWRNQYRDRPPWRAI